MLYWKTNENLVRWRLSIREDSLQGFGLVKAYPREHNWHNLSKDNLKWKTVRIWFHEAQDAQKADKRVQIVLKKNLG